MAKHKGSGLVEYALPLAVLGIVVGIGLYELAANGTILNNFINSTKGTYNSADKSISIGHQDNVAATIYSQNPTNTTPTITPSGTMSIVAKSNCTSSSCDIDFGAFTLTGIPENFGDYVKTNGTSGGADSLASLIMQIAQQVETTDPTTAADIKDLANLGHFMAQIAKTNETMVSMLLNGGQDYALLASTYSNFLMQSNIPLPSNLTSVLPGYNAQSQALIGQLEKTIAQPSSDPNVINSVPGAKFQSLLDKVNSSNLTADQKNVVQKLANQINYIVQNHYVSTKSTLDNISSTGTYGGDYANLNYMDILVPQASLGTNVRSALMCKSGHRFDNGSECNL